MTEIIKLVKHPDKCPNCSSEQVYYNRFVPDHPRGEYACDDCGWGIDAEIGETTFTGEQVETF
jgi:transcription initiation factor TFIIIB Brf1 subunit/transcription initiation factor TFIIB